MENSTKTNASITMPEKQPKKKEKPVKAPREKLGKSDKMSLKTKKAIYGYIFISPMIIGFLLFFVRPLIESVSMSFSNVVLQTGKGGFILEPIGLQNYKTALQIDPEFFRFFTEEITQMLIDIPAVMIFSFFVALLLNQKFIGRGIARTIFFLPIILSAGVFLEMDVSNTLLQEISTSLEEMETGGSSVTKTLENLFLTGGPADQYVQIVFDMLNRIYDIAITSGIQIVIFLVGLQSISESLHEAAKIEGCSSWEAFWKITLPMVSPMILVNAIYTIVAFFIRSDNAVMTKITDTMMGELNYGLSSAMAWIYFGAVALILAIVAGVIGKWVYNND